MAISFLEKQEELQLGLEEVNFTCICLGGLALPSHDYDNSEDSIRDYIQKGYYGLSDYSVVYWQDHVNKIIRGKALDSEVSFKAFNAAVHPFLNRRFTPTTKITNQSALSNFHLNRFKDKAFYPHLLQAVAHNSDEQSSLPKSSQACRPLVEQLLTVREIMERVVSEADSSFKERLQMMYGSNLFKCPELQCSFFYEGFPMARERDSHRNKHKRAFVCTYPGCPSALIGFTTSKELNKHNDDYHGNVVDKHSFPWNGNVASIDIIKQINEGNLSEVQAWADQWEGGIPIERLWFFKPPNRFDSSPLGKAISLQRNDIFETFLVQAPPVLFERAQNGSAESSMSLDQRGSVGYQVFVETMENGNEDVVTTYLRHLRKLAKINVPLFGAALSLNIGESRIDLFLSHAVTDGNQRSTDMAIMYLKEAVERRHEESARYILFHLGLWDSLRQEQRVSNIVNLALRSEANYDFLDSILPDFKEDASGVSNWFHQLCGVGISSGVATMLQDEHFNPNQTDEFGYTPLVIAIRNNKPKIVQQLVKDPRVLLDSCQSEKGMDALHWAISGGSVAQVNILLQAGMPIKETNHPVLDARGESKTAIA